MADPTPEIAAKIVDFVRAGASFVSAARAAGVDNATFNDWMDVAKWAAGPCQDLLDHMRDAEAEARASVEIEIRRKNPVSWLRTRKRPHRYLNAVPAPDEAKKRSRNETRGGLTAKRRRFVQEYRKDLNATQAAIRAGYAPGTANEVGPALKKNPAVAAELARQERELWESQEITPARWLKETAALAFANPKALCAALGLPVDNIPDGLWHDIAGIKVNLDAEGNRLLEVKFWNKPQALALLGRHLKLFVDRMEVPGDQTINIVQLLQLLGPLPDGRSSLKSASPQDSNGTAIEPPRAAAVLETELVTGYGIQTPVRSESGGNSAALDGVDDALASLAGNVFKNSDGTT